MTLGLLACDAGRGVPAAHRTVELWERTTGSSTILDDSLSDLGLGRAHPLLRVVSQTIHLGMTRVMHLGGGSRRLLALGPFVAFSFVPPAGDPVRQEAIVVEYVHLASRPDLKDRAVLRGTVSDRVSGAPVSGVVVATESGSSGLSDESGGFRLAGLMGGRYRLRITHAAYGERFAHVDVPAGHEIVVRVSVAMRAIALDSIRVTSEAARRPGEPPYLNRGNVVDGPDLEAARRRGETVGQVAARLPTLHARSGRFSTVDEVATGVCLESRRATPRLMIDERSVEPRLPFCDPIAVILDAVYVGDPIGFLRGLKLDDFESVEFLPPALAGPRYGLLAGNGGVLLLTTRRRD